MEKIISPVKAIRQYCIGCCDGHRGEPRKCTATGCVLYPYRLGTYPNRAYSEERREKMREVIKKLQEEGKFKKKKE